MLGIPRVSKTEPYVGVPRDSKKGTIVTPRNPSGFQKGNNGDPRHPLGFQAGISIVPKDTGFPNKSYYKDISKRGP